MSVFATGYHAPRKNNGSKEVSHPKAKHAKKGEPRGLTGYELKYISSVLGVSCKRSSLKEVEEEPRTRIRGFPNLWCHAAIIKYVVVNATHHPTAAVAKQIISPTKPSTMKLFSTVVVSSCLAAQAFGVTPVVSQTKGLGKPALVTKSPLRQKNVAELSPLFRDPTITRGGAIPGLQAYSDALDKNPITMKALTSLVGWFLGDLLAQVSFNICLKSL
jgi:hypothetical protein